MARKSVPVSANRGNLTKAQREAREQGEEALKRGQIADYEPESLTDDGIAIFAQLVESIPDEMLAKVDGYTVETAADAIDKMRKCRDEIAKRGLIVRAKNGNGIMVEEQNKHVAIYQRYSEIARKCLSDLGLNPSARAKIAADAAERAKPKSPTVMAALGRDG